MVNVKIMNEDPYGELICKYFSTHFHKAISPDSKQLLEILTSILIGDKNTRLGPVPPPEQLVVIRKTISQAIEMNQPIPILVAWGGRKTNADKGVDVAEVAALQQLMRMSDSVRAYFPAGVSINIRIEDLGADWIYRNERDDIFHVVNSYSTQFTTLVQMLCKEHDINPVRESLLMEKPAYFLMSKDYSTLLSEVISHKLIDANVDVKTLAAFKELESRGWKGDLSMPQIHYYIERYKVLNPNLPMQDYIDMLADYFGGAKARYELNGRANPKTKLDSFISISFVPPIPDAPVSLFNNVLYYRTVPMKDGKTHIAPWRAKGYLEINENNEVKIKVTSWSNKDEIEMLQQSQIQFCEDNLAITVDTDYHVKEFVMQYYPPFP